ncbi:chemotaxis protein CheD [Aestuariibacter sp. AA17]|uniref:Probable chemoreceptor glutamine deamidase CheD n=1 Tax=Fluctibacter corallii TaxID=2984329 RepID=A0ABT3ACN6_9ALTE|nr:chemotaxis protein CheD [Aestuariibacter sp. AA17]MCV2886444.1 chemotaxis protein CheD [Aestuariibacter sp. AA17]
MNQKNPKKLVLNIGELVFGRGNRIVHTLLGSCIAVTLWHPDRKLAGICHFALPDNKTTPDRHIDCRYAEDCFKAFEIEAKKRHADLSKFTANIYGGGNMLGKPPANLHFSKHDLPMEVAPVGEKNALIALTLCHKHGVQVDTVDVGEFGYRKLTFDTRNGQSNVTFVASDKA